ncbi:MAG: hypothetical protein J5545_04640 [Bacteroidaceae bacterium]|nr:hypothetical protein [Bacteroidaceae bacterium]
MKRTTSCVLVLLCALLLGSTHVSAQNLKQNQRTAQTIRTQPDKYYYGEGSGESEPQARQIAMQDLQSKISSNVIGSFDLHMDNLVHGENATSESVMQGVISTYTAGHINNTKELILERSPQIRVMRYITKSSMDSVFNLRRERVLAYIRDAMVAESKQNIDIALRYYSWALALLQSVQDPSSLKYAVNGIAEGEKVLVNWLPEKMREIVRGLKASVAEIDGQEVKMKITYKDGPLSNIDFYYFDGKRRISMGAKEGNCEIYLEPGQDVANLEIEYEYAYKEEMRDDPELDLVSQIYRPPTVREAKNYVHTGNKKEMKAAMAQLQATAQAQATPHDNFLKRNQAKDYLGIIMKIADAIKQKKYDSAREFFTPEGYEMYERLLAYGHAKILTIPELHCFPYRDKIICRSIPMRFSFDSTKREFVEDVNFTFNSEDLIESVAFGLDKATREDIYTDKHLMAWGDTTCTMLATFLENYKTAWALHRLDYIQGIFADDARIITGSMLKQATLKNRRNDLSIGVAQLSSHPLVKYTEQNKKQYMKSLEECFRKNKVINIRFSDCLVDKMYDARFGINIRQDYYSNTYSDTGYLFLMIDVTDPLSPMIQYRTWQPERDPTINNKPGMDKNSPEGRFWGVVTGNSFD